MSNIYYTSDLHFNHTFVAATRDYSDAERHDEDLIERFNSVLTKRDHLWILGDVFNGSITEGLKQVERLNGVKHLVIGNHDAPWPENRRSHNAQRRFLEVFETVQLHAQHRIGEHRVNLSHLPYGAKKTFIEAGPEWRKTDHEGYYANLSGEIRGRHGRILKPWVAGSGYEYVGVPTGATTRKNVTVHSMVCAAFHGTRPEGMQVAHNDGNSLNNRADNLRWSTSKENAADKKLHGTGTGERYSRSGEDNPKAKLSGADVLFIRESDEDKKLLAKQFDVSICTINDILQGRSWKGIVPKVTFDNKEVDRYTQWRLPDEGLPLLHGHVHHAWARWHNQINVGVDFSPYPLHRDHIQELLDGEY